MTDNTQSQPEEAPELLGLCFELQAEADMTKHLGALEATNALIELCRIAGGQAVLDVGCGVGRTPAYLAKKHGCRAVGIDIRQKMIDRANERAVREGLEDRTEFRVADVQDLPFDDGLFDAVIGESIIAFAQDKPKAVSECKRVTKPGGYVGFTEAHWTKPPTPELQAYMTRTFGPTLEMLTAEGWEQLLCDAGLQDVVARVHSMSVRTEAISRIKRLGIGDVLRTWGRFFSMARKRPEYRDFLKEALSEPKELLSYWAYGVYAGRK